MGKIKLAVILIAFLIVVGTIWSISNSAYKNTEANLDSVICNTIECSFSISGNSAITFQTVDVIVPHVPIIEKTENLKITPYGESFSVFFPIAETSNTRAHYLLVFSTGQLISGSVIID